MEAIRKCYVCGNYYDELKLVEIKVPDQGAGYVRKPICRRCIREIEGRSNEGDK